MPAQMDIDVVMDYIRNSSAETKIYLGADSERINIRGVWMVDFTLAVVIHIDGQHGCKVFGEVIREADYTKRADAPQFRLMSEVHKVAELYLKLADVLLYRDVEIHLDLNPEDFHKSNGIVNQAMGYIKGVCGIDPKIKPMSPAASYAADRLKEII
jgi:predicted RNase H-related nuclease YkuK (DUF458 family)